MRSIENDRELMAPSKNPFQLETALYEKQKQRGDIVVLVTVPDFYHVGMPNIGHQIVEYQINQLPGFFAYRCYLKEDYGLIRELLDPPDLIMVSMSYEGSYIRSLRVLDQLGIPLRARDRTDAHPVVVFGGRAVSMNPLPIFEIADAIGVGDSDELVRDICTTFSQTRTRRQDMFDLLASKQGIIIPSKYRVSTNGDGHLERWEASPGASDNIIPQRGTVFPHSWYLSSETDYNDIGYYDGKTFFSMEVVKACASKCLFCAEGFNNGKMRFTNDTARIVRLGLWAGTKGANLVKLFFPANATVETTKDIVRSLLDSGLHPRVGSAKAEKIDREYLELVGRSGQEKIAFAPETGDYALRSRLGKPGMTNDVLHHVVAHSAEAGIPNIDLYFIMNLPGEDPQGLQKTIDLVGDLRDTALHAGMSGQVRIAAPNFFPKAWTPFQYAAAGDIDEYHEKIASLEHALGETVRISTMKGNVDLLSQNIMSRGGYEVGELLVGVYCALKEKELELGRFAPDTLDDWRRVMAELHITESRYFDEKSPEKPLPWEHIRLYDDPSKLRKAWSTFRSRRIPLPVL